MAPEETIATVRYQRRTERRTVRTSYRVMERDTWLLEALCRLRFLTTTQLLRLRFGASRSAINKRLRRLFDEGLVRVWVRCLESDNVYSLTVAGRAVLATDRGACSLPRGLDRDLDHTLAINDVRIALAATLPALGAELLSWLSDCDLRPHRSARLVPDARFTIRWSNGSETSFYLEVDRNTRSAAALQRKLIAYRAMTYRHIDSCGFGNDVILVVAHHPAWLARYRVHAAHSALSLPVWFATLADVVAHGATSDIWCKASDEQAHSLAVLADLQNGSEGPAPEAAALTGASARSSARVPRPETA